MAIKNKYGQYFTIDLIADFMVSLISKVPRNVPLLGVFFDKCPLFIMKKVAILRSLLREPL